MWELENKRGEERSPCLCQSQRISLFGHSHLGVALVIALLYNYICTNLFFVTVLVHTLCHKCSSWLLWRMISKLRSLLPNSAINTAALEVHTELINVPWFVSRIEVNCRIACLWFAQFQNVVPIIWQMNGWLFTATEIKVRNQAIVDYIMLNCITQRNN